MTPLQINLCPDGYHGQAAVGDHVQWVDDNEGPLSGRVTEIWPEQEIAVVERDEDHLHATFFVPTAKLRAARA